MEVERLNKLNRMFLDINYGNIENLYVTGELGEFLRQWREHAFEITVELDAEISALRRKCKDDN